ncbi:hypothetical protein QYF36_026968 [Acer negundo]|nr:hypothetical protein QYF36_026968 [Acer negundo]
MDFYGQHAYDEESEVSVVVCTYCGMAGHYIWSCPSKERDQASRELDQALNSYLPWPINERYANSHNQWSSYEPYDNTYNPELRNYQDFSWSHNEVNTFEQPVSPSMEDMFQRMKQRMEQQNQFDQEMQQSAERINQPWHDLDALRYEFSDDFSGVGDEEEEKEETKDKEGETEESVKEEDDAPFEAPLLYKELKPLKGEEVEKEENEEKVKEVEDVSFEALLQYKELKPYVPSITFPSRLHKSNWNKWFSELISPHFIVNIYLPLLIVCRNMPVRKIFFQDLITYRRKFKTLEFG